MMEYVDAPLHDERHELTSNGLACRPHECRAVAYVADFVVVDGADVLFEQKAVIDSYALRSDVAVSRYVIDSGQLPEGALVGHQLESLVRTIRCSGERAVVVEHVSRFAMDYAVALRVAAALSAWGITVHEARGGPTIVEHDLAVTIAADAVDMGDERCPAARAKGCSPLAPRRAFPFLRVTDCVKDA